MEHKIFDQYVQRHKIKCDDSCLIIPDKIFRAFALHYEFDLDEFIETKLFSEIIKNHTNVKYERTKTHILDGDKEIPFKIMSGKYIILGILMTEHQENEIDNLNSEHQKIDISRYDIAELLGRGTQGKVYSVKDRETGKDYAMKIVAKNGPVYDMTKEEISIHTKFKHPNIVQIETSFETDNSINIVMDRCGDNLREVEKKTKFTNREAMIIFSQIAEAVKYIHEIGYAHRDIKSENIVRCGNVWKLIDFGFAVPKDKLLTKPCCTIDYLAPEVIKVDMQKSSGMTYLGQPTDIWTLGVLLYEILTTQVPFYKYTFQATYKAITDEPVKFLYITWNPDIKDLIERMLEKDPKKRITINEVVHLTNLILEKLSVD